jgi:hypothetical protein
MASLVPNAGKAVISGRMFGTTPSQAEPRYLGWGTGAGAGSASSTDVSTPATEARATGTSTQFTTSVTNDTHQVVGTLTANANKTITNVGIFDAAGTRDPAGRGGAVRDLRRAVAGAEFGRQHPAHCPRAIHLVP